MVDTGARRRLRGVLAVLAVVAAIAVLAGTVDRATVDEVLALPEPGTVRADRLSNGTPVFIVHRPPETAGTPPTIDVVQAFTTEVEGPITGLVGWCADAQQFVGAHHGPLYDVRGRRLPSSTAGRSGTTQLFGRRTALDDLIHRQVETVEGRTGADDPIVVGGVQELQAWQVAQRPDLDPDVPPDGCRVVPPSLEPDAEEPFRRLVDHSFLAGPVDPDAAGWQITDGWLLVSPDGTATWCDAEPTRGGDPGAACPEPRDDLAVGFAYTPAQTGGVAAALGGPLAARIADGVVQRVAVMPDSRWRGSSLRGAERYTAVLSRSATADRGVLGLVDVVLTDDTDDGAGPAGPCLAGAVDGGGRQRPASSVRVDGDVLVDVGGTTDPLGLDQLALGPDGPQLAVVVDAATCRTLAVRDLG